MACTCNLICTNDCAANAVTCIGDEPVCANSFSFTGVGGAIITAAQLAQLETAINQERIDGSRRYNAVPPSCIGDCAAFTTVACSNNSFSAYPFAGSRGVGDIIEATHFNGVKSANNGVTSASGWGGTVTANFNVGAIIYASETTELQTKINETRNACICNGHCSCDGPNCGCNGECPTHYYYTP